MKSQQLIHPKNDNSKMSNKRQDRPNKLAGHTHCRYPPSNSGWGDVTGDSLLDIAASWSFDGFMSYLGE